MNEEDEAMIAEAHALSNALLVLLNGRRTTIVKAAIFGALGQVVSDTEPGDPHATFVAYLRRMADTVEGRVSKGDPREVS